jgi:hypothetical protein
MKNCHALISTAAQRFNVTGHSAYQRPAVGVTTPKPRSPIELPFLPHPGCRPGIDAAQFQDCTFLEDMQVWDSSTVYCDTIANENLADAGRALVAAVPQLCVGLPKAAPSS